MRESLVGATPRAPMLKGVTVFTGYLNSLLLRTLHEMRTNTSLLRCLLLRASDCQLQANYARTHHHQACCAAQYLEAQQKNDENCLSSVGESTIDHNRYVVVVTFYFCDHHQQLRVMDGAFCVHFTASTFQIERTTVHFAAQVGEMKRNCAFSMCSSDTFTF